MNNIHERGYWLDKEGHLFDRLLAIALLGVFRKKQTVVDIGCGPGEYVRFLRGHGINCCGFDGNPLTPEFDPQLKIVDFSEKVQIGVYDWALCLEVGEHIPQQYESNFISNLHSCNRQGIVLSWAVPGQDGRGHVNTRPNEYVVSVFTGLGYHHDQAAEKRLRAIVGLPYFRDTLMVFRRLRFRINKKAR